MKKLFTTLLAAASLLTGAPGLAVAAAQSPAPASAAAVSPQERANLIQLGAAAPSLLQQRAGDAVLIVGDEGRGRGRWRDRDDYGYYGFGIGSLILTALIVSIVIISQQPYQ
jgi:hypothetical protein